MADCLPLIPKQEDEVCADVRPVLREVFKELDYLPPLAPQRHGPDPPGDDDSRPLPQVNEWIENYESDRKTIWTREGELKQQYAKRIAREPLPNIYKLHPSPATRDKAPTWRTEQGLLDRSDLMPAIFQNSYRDESLWVKNILNRSSGDLSSMVVKSLKDEVAVSLNSVKEETLLSISVGEVMPLPPQLPPPSPPTRCQPVSVVCVPPELEFVNFTVGHLHTRRVRVVNVSKCEVRLSVRPPRRRELRVALCGPRGLTLSSGAAQHICVHFRPRDVRVLRDVLLVRVSIGKPLYVPIICYMQPPILDVIVPAVSSSVFSCTSENVEKNIPQSTDCLELGAQLLGDVHCVNILFNCQAEHVSFFLLTEDAWESFNLDDVTSCGSLVADPFVVSPVWWAGGGRVGGAVRCRARCAGLHAAALRLLASTALVRPLALLADALYFTHKHITIQAHQKNYDICSDDEPACEYYVHLGTAFPNRALSETVHIVNHSPVSYSYYWSVREWGECSCWGERDEVAEGEQYEGLCVGALEAMERELKSGPDSSRSRNASCIRVEPSRGVVAPRSTCNVHVCAPDVGDTLGVQRAVMMLILKDIPKESFPEGYEPMIVKTEIMKLDSMPGMKPCTREVCEVVCAQMEVWWEVAPVRFVLDPPVLPLRYSRRVHSLEVMVRATQLFGSEGIGCSWQVPQHVTSPAPMQLTATTSCGVTIKYQLPELIDDTPQTDVIILEAARSEWAAQCCVRRECGPRAPALRPARCWRGVLPPAPPAPAPAGAGGRVHNYLSLLNYTYQPIHWVATPFRWQGGAAGGAACGAGAGAACGTCRVRGCACALLRPTQGTLGHAHGEDILYEDYIPLVDGCVATLVQVQRTEVNVSPAEVDSSKGGAARVQHVGTNVADAGPVDGAGNQARRLGSAALVAYRVLAPRLVLRVVPCCGDKGAECKGCAVDEGDRNCSRGTATLRPKAALTIGRKTCYRLRFINLTPLPTRVKWHPALEEDILKVTFSPKEFKVGSYAQVDIQVVVEARKVCGRRLHVYRAHVLHAYKHIYLVIDTAISGLEILCEVPLGGGEQTESTVIMRRTQAESFPWNTGKVKPTTDEEIFKEEEKRRALVANNTCRCDYKEVYIEPVKEPRPLDLVEEESLPVEIVWEPPPLIRVCSCHGLTKPIIPEFTESYCLQFENLPLRTVRTKIVTIRNESALSAKWSTAIRNWPRRHTRTIDKDDWRRDVCPSGVAVQVCPRGGVLGARGGARLRVRVYADCWGGYRDQLLIKIENLEPIVVDLWIEAVGPPLQFAVNTKEDSNAPVMWISASDPERTLRARNASRAGLAVCAYTLTEHEHKQDMLPFRLYIRLFDALPPTCPCVELEGFLAKSFYKEDSFSENSTICSRTSITTEISTGVELYLGPDCGIQDSSFYEVEPDCTTIPPGEWFSWRVSLRPAPHGEAAPPGAVLLRSVPLVDIGKGWCRPTPPAQVVSLRQSAREGRLELSCQEVRVTMCALDLFGDVMRIRKHFMVKNVGNGPMEVCVKTEEPWWVVSGAERSACGAGGGCGARGGQRREREGVLYLMPRSSEEMCVEVRVNTAEMCPPAEARLPAQHCCGVPAAPEYGGWRRTTTDLFFYDGDNVLKTLPLILELEYPNITIEPNMIDFGFVTDGDTKKSYFTIVHSSRTVTLDLEAEWDGGKEFSLWPEKLTLAPGVRARIYIQYTARWCGAPVEGCMHVWAGGGAWCRARGGARAAPALTLPPPARTPHDYTDDNHLLPPVHYL